jgi:hypothetical protein
MVTGARRIKFPAPGATKEKEDVLLVDTERMLVHFNQDHPELKQPAQRVTPKIIEHCSDLARGVGWAGTKVVKNAIDGHTSGLMLLRERKTTINAAAPVDVVDAKVVPRAIKG